MNLILMVCGIVSIICGMIGDSKGTISKILYQAFPVLFGIYAIFVSIVGSGWVTIN